MEQITHANATEANLFTNFTPMNTTVPVREKGKKKENERKFKIELIRCIIELMRCKRKIVSNSSY